MRPGPTLFSQQSALQPVSARSHALPHSVGSSGTLYGRQSRYDNEMTMRTGTANLPLHGGRVPIWLATRMAALGRVITEAIVHHYGRQEFLRRLADPFWFQSFGSVMGMDWHSSGITTSVIGALKRGLAPLQDELGLYICGGRGAHSRRTPAELSAMGERTGLDTAPLIRISRLVAKIDSALVQDGYELYLHGFFATREGDWCVVQQGMNAYLREARRYHWGSDSVVGFFDSPHKAIEGRNVGSIINLSDRGAAENRGVGLELVREGPGPVVTMLKRQGQTLPHTLDLFAAEGPHLQMPARHDVRAPDIDLKRLHATLAAAADRGPKDFADLLLLPGIGARTVAAVAFVAEVLHGAPYRFHDPARFSLAHGGKDGQPFPVPLQVYDETIAVLKRALVNAKLGRNETLEAIRRLDQQARSIDDVREGPSFAEYVAIEREHSASYGGRTV
jgi:hypothetical protein